MKRIFALLIFLMLSAAAASAQTNYKTYSNARFGYSIAYPSNLLKPQGEAANGDGQIFTGDGAEMRVYGSNLLLNETLPKEYEAIVKEHGDGVKYKIYRKNFFVVSGVKDRKIFYQKTMMKNGAYVTFLIEYDEAKRGVYDKAVAQMAKTFK